ncbi:MAG: hypothetical protein QM534_10975 [Sediminibacterium sp.]|nr:hypothetical protein [Sediminibacterium sp.]
MKNNLLIAAGLVVLVIFSCTNKKGKMVPSSSNPTSSGTNSCDTITYAKHIAPIMSSSCNSCHSSGNPLGDMTTYSGVKLKVDDGSFKQKVLVDKTMPKSPVSPLSQKQLEMIQCWLDKGAPNN